MNDILLWAVPITLMVSLALLPAIKVKSWKVFFFALFIVVFGIMLPLFSFFISSILAPEWKGGARLGWIDSFHEGKLALFPLVLWATAALYVLEAWPIQKRTDTWLVLGLFLGAIVSTVCVVHGVITLSLPNYVFLLIPLYVSGWYGWRARQVIRSSPLKWSYGYAVLGSIPFWIYSVILSRNHYLNLPDKPPDCFIVTAATQGHPSVVGPFIPIDKQALKSINQQLLTFWQFEALWKRRYPISYGFFRRIYNIWGYQAARLISNPWKADIIYILLKPVEFIARVLVIIGRRRKIS